MILGNHPTDSPHQSTVLFVHGNLSKFTFVWQQYVIVPFGQPLSSMKLIGRCCFQNRRLLSF